MDMATYKALARTIKNADQRGTQLMTKSWEKNGVVYLPAALYKKVIDAWYRYCSTRNLVPVQPESPITGKRQPNGHVIIELNNVNGHLATYRFTGNKLVRVAP